MQKFSKSSKNPLGSMTYFSSSWMQLKYLLVVYVLFHNTFFMKNWLFGKFSSSLMNFKSEIGNWNFGRKIWLLRIMFKIPCSFLVVSICISPDFSKKELSISQAYNSSNFCLGIFLTVSKNPHWSLYGSNVFGSTNMLFPLANEVHCKGNAIKFQNHFLVKKILIWE